MTRSHFLIMLVICALSGTKLASEEPAPVETGQSLENVEPESFSDSKDETPSTTAQRPRDIDIKHELNAWLARDGYPEWNSQNADYLASLSPSRPCIYELFAYGVNEISPGKRHHRR